jgi:zinc/manganese transport system substrate-binding protein
MRLRITALFGVAVAVAMTASQARADLKVFTCVPEWEALVKVIGADKVQVSNGTPPSEDPDSIKPTPAMIAALQQADLIVCTGIGLSDGIDQMLARAQNPKLAPGQPGNFVASDYADIMPPSEDRPVGQVQQAGKHELHEDGNPHIFSDPRNVVRVAAQLAKRMIALDPDNAALYGEHAKAFIHDLNALTKELEKKAAPLKGVSIAVSHVHSDYLLRWLGVVTASILEGETGVPPGPERLTQIIEAVPAKGIKFIIYAAYEDPGASKFVADKAKIPLVKLPFTIGGTPEARDYFSFFRDSVDRLLDGLNGRERS